jgi:hypothetical protein
MLDWISELASSVLVPPSFLRHRTLGATAVWLVAACLSGCREPAMHVRELGITSDEYGYHMPDSVSAGLVHITLHNVGRDIHEAMLVRFTDTIGTAAAYADSVRAHVDFPERRRGSSCASRLAGISSSARCRPKPMDGRITSTVCSPSSPSNSLGEWIDRRSRGRRCPIRSRIDGGLH